MVRSTPSLPVPAAGPAASLLRLIAAERRKLFSTRAWLWMLLASTVWTTVFSVLAIALNGHLGGLTPSLSNAAGQRILLVFSAGGSGPLAAVLGATAATGEYRHRTATATFLATPRRSEAVVAKTLTYLLVGLGYGLVCLALNLAIALPWFAASRIVVLPSGLGNVGLTVAVVVSVGLFAAVGVGLGWLLHGQLATVAGLLIYLYVAEPFLSHIAGFRAWTPYLPGVAADGMTQATQAGVVLLPPPLGGLVFAMYGVAFMLAGMWATTRRDIA